MAIFMDKASRDGWAHLVSDRLGETGRVELLEFGRKIGIARRLHRNSTYAEHYDIRGQEIERAMVAGARAVSRRDLAGILRRKRRVDNAVSTNVKQCP